MPCIASFESYLSSNTNTLFDKGNYFCGLLDDGIFKFGQHGAFLGQYIATLNDDKDTANKCASAAAGFTAGRDAISAIRFIPAFHKLCTGQVFWQKNSDGWRRVKQDDGKAVRIPHEDLGVKWVKVEVDGKRIWKNAGGEESTDGKYIEDPQNGECVTHDWMSIAMDVLALIARVLSPVRWLHNLKAYDLGEHAKRMGSVVAAVWGVILTINLVQEVRDLINEVDVQAIRKRVWDVFQAFIDLIAILFDFGIGSAHPGLAIVGAGLNIVSAGSLLAREAVFYS